MNVYETVVFYFAVGFIIGGLLAVFSEFIRRKS